MYFETIMHVLKAILKLVFFMKLFTRLKLHADILWALIKAEGILAAQNNQSIVHLPTSEGSLVIRTEVCKELVFLFFY